MLFLSITYLLFVKNIVFSQNEIKRLQKNKTTLQVKRSFIVAAVHVNYLTKMHQTQEIKIYKNMNARIRPKLLV